MSTSDSDLVRHEVQKLHLYTAEAYTKGRSDEMERLLEQVTEKLESLEDWPFLVKERFWIAGIRQMQGEYRKAVAIYENLLKLTVDSFRKNLTDEDSLRYLASTFHNLVKIKSSLPEPSTKELLEIIANGLDWLVQVGRPEWTASLRLQRGLTFKRLGEWENARREMEKALELAFACPDAPGYSLETYQLELARLLCISAANSAADEPKNLRYAVKDPEAVTKIDQLQEQLYRESDRVVQAIIALDQAISTISHESTKLKCDQDEQVNRMQIRLSLPDTVAEDHQQHVVCFVALPFEDNEKTFAYKTVLLPALCKVLELKPYYWQVGRADDKYYAETIERNIFEWMKRAHTYIAEISDLNPNVMMELGYMRWSRKPEQPLIVLKRNDIELRLADLADMILISYKPVHGDGAVDGIAKELKIEFEKKDELLKIGTNKAHYLSPLSLSIKEDFAERLSKIYITMERFVKANREDILLQVPGLSKNMAEAAQKDVAELLNELKK